MDKFTLEAFDRLKKTLELDNVDLMTVLVNADVRIRRLTDEKLNGESDE